MQKKTIGITYPVIFVTILIILVALGTLFVFEASTAESLVTFGTPYFLLKQHLSALIIGSIAFIGGLLIPSQFWITSAPLLYWSSIVLLVATLIPGIGLDLNGARRWLAVGPIRFQTVEILKFALPAYFAQWMSVHQKFSAFLFLTALPLGLILLQPDLGSLLLILGIAVGIFFLSGAELKKLGILALAGIPLILLVIVLSPYRLKRLTTFIDPESDPLGASFHIRQITLALGRGGWFGQGLGNSQQKFSYIPEASTDSIFAIVAEEVGFVGSLLIITLFIGFLYTGYTLIQNTKKSKTLKLFGAGIIIWFAVQITLNISAVVGLVPLTGVPLPFFSYGRTSLVMLLFASGVVLRIGREK